MRGGIVARGVAAGVGCIELLVPHTIGRWTFHHASHLGVFSHMEDRMRNLMCSVALVSLISLPLVRTSTAVAPGIDCDAAWNYITGLTCQDPCSQGCVIGPINSPAGWG